MSKTIKEIWNDLSIHSQQALQYANDKLTLGNKDIKKVWYSEEEVDKIIERCMSAKIHIEDFKKTRKILCPSCGKEFIKLGKYNWKPNCLCFKRGLILSVG